MRNQRGLRITSLLHKLIAEYIEQNANSNPLITVTGVDLSKNSKNATVLISVFPDNKEGFAISYLMRHGKNIRAFVSKHSKLKIIPWFSFSLDYGEKNRQKIDSISREVNS